MDKLQNPLFLIAANKHKEDHRTAEYPFLTDTPNNETTYVLGFCRGVNYATVQMSERIKNLETELETLKNKML